MKRYTLLLFLLFVILSFGCSKNEEDNYYDPNSIKVQVILNQGSASSIKLIPIDSENYYYEILVVVKQNTNKVSTSLPSFTDHIGLTIKGNQKEYNGYILIYGIKKEFTVADWNYDSTFYLSDFK